MAIFSKNKDNHNNAPAHSSSITTAKLAEIRYELLSYSPHFPESAPCDFSLFPNIKKWLGEKWFSSNEEVITETEVYFAGFNKSYFSDGLRAFINQTMWTNFCKRSCEITFLFHKINIFLKIWRIQQNYCHLLRFLNFQEDVL